MLIVLASACQQTFSNNFVADAGEAGVCGEGGLPPAAKACSDTIEAVARAKERCGSSYDAAYDTLLDGAAVGNCANITSIRDETQLCFECVPTLQTLPCTDIASDTLPQSCQQQLQHQ